MGELTKNTPKPMLKIQGKPLLAHKIEMLPDEIDEVVLVVGYLQEQIRNFFGDQYANKKIVYVEQQELNGTAGALHSAKDVLREKFLVTTGDDLYLKKDLAQLSKLDLGVLVLEVDNPDQFGVIKMDEKGDIVEIVEKPKIVGPALANVGAYILSRDFFVYPLVDIGKGEFGLPQTMMQMKDRFKIEMQKAGAWFPIGNPEDLQKSAQILEKMKNL